MHPSKPVYSEVTLAKLYTFVTRQWGLREYRRGWLKGDCVFCGKIGKLGVNLEENRVNCFVCGSHGSVIKAILEVSGFKTFTEVYNSLKLLEDSTYLKPRLIPQQKATKPKLPESFRLLSLGEGYLADLARKYIIKRGFNPDELSAKGIGYCSRGEYSGCIILPYYQAGELVYFIARRFIMTGAKFKYPKTEDFGIGKSELIYNADSLAIYNKIRIVESVFNAETLGPTAIALGGKVISETQLSMVIKSPCKYVSILLDPDAIVLAYKLALVLAEYKNGVKVIKLPDEEDVNSLGKAETLKLEKQVPWKQYSELYREYLSYL
jgi:DNA primase